MFSTTMLIKPSMVKMARNHWLRKHKTGTVAYKSVNPKHYELIKKFSDQVFAAKRTHCASSSTSEGEFTATPIFVTYQGPSPIDVGLTDKCIRLEARHVSKQQIADVQCSEKMLHCCLMAQQSKVFI